MVARWVLHELTDENRRKRVEDCRENLKMFREGKWRLCDAVTGDESWLFYRQIGRKQIMLHGLVKVNMQNQWFAVANLSQKSW